MSWKRTMGLCYGCGADCAGWLCARCRGEHRECRTGSRAEQLEDDYSEDSDADSICDDGGSDDAPPDRRWNGRPMR